MGFGSTAAQCHTDLSICSTAAQGFHHGDWYSPDGDRLPIPSADAGNIFESRTAKRVDIRHVNNANEPTGVIFQLMLSIILLTDM